MSVSDARKAMAIERKRIDRAMYLCVKREGFHYTEDVDPIPFFGLQLTPVAEREAFVSTFGYGLVTFMQRGPKPNPDENPASFAKAYASCSSSAPKSKVASLGGNVLFGEKLRALMGSEAWKSADRKWNSCMTASGFRLVGTSDVAPIASIQKVELPGGGVERDVALDALLQQEIAMAKADDVCRRSTMDLVELERIDALQTELVNSDPIFRRDVAEILNSQ